MIAEQAIDIQSYETQAQLLKVIAHPVRLAILEILRDGEHCVCHMEAHLGYRQAYISQQLMVLREAGLVQDRRDGWNIFYHVTEPRIFTMLSVVQEVIGLENQPPGPKLAVVCPCPKCKLVDGH
jgi:ArsR family transcriptional regulator